ncbi:MAG: hypothetical protein K2X49_23615, partial [Acetobacteraceae bacterium]|nr:hypothetical protein [Acetobacteraceae bacterium]
MPQRRPLSRLGALALAALVLPATAPQAQKFPGSPAPQAWPAPWSGGGYVPPQEAGQPNPAAPPGIAGSKFDTPRLATPRLATPRLATPRPATPRPATPRPAAPASGPVRSDVGADDLRLQAEDPPSVVGRVARTTGAVSLRLPDSEDWRPAAPNTAIVAGNAIWVEPGARAAIEAGASRLTLDGGSALQIEALDEGGLRATLAQGGVFLRLAGLDAFGGTVDVATPEASIATALDGRILIEAAAPDGSRPGRIAVFEGAAEVTLASAGASSGEPLRLGPGEAVRLLPGAAPVIEAAGPTTPLMAWSLAAEPRVAVPAAARGMTGIGELGLAGRWDRHAEYGDVWYPPVQQDWVPYSDGSWEWREPWGWTWVDAVPWGFATSHYGRWVRLGPRWGWAPAPVAVIGLPALRPVWAPALVTFFGGPVGYGGHGRPVGWIPLGPREPWYPWYRASPAYVTRVNIRQVTHLAPVRQRWVAWGGPERRWDAPRWQGPRRDGP